MLYLTGAQMAWSSFVTRIGASVGAAVAGGTAWVLLEPRAEDAAEKMGLVPTEVAEATIAPTTPTPPAAETRYAEMRPELDLTRHPDARPSFNCDDAEAEMEQLICADPSLAEADRMMGHIYSTLKERGLANSNLTFKQQAWIASRNACLIAIDPKECVRDKMLRRIDELSSL